MKKKNKLGVLTLVLLSTLMLGNPALANWTRLLSQAFRALEFDDMMQKQARDIANSAARYIPRQLPRGNRGTGGPVQSGGDSQSPDVILEGRLVYNYKTRDVGARFLEQSTGIRYSLATRCGTNLAIIRYPIISKEIKYVSQRIDDPYQVQSIQNYLCR